MEENENQVNFDPTELSNQIADLKQAVVDSTTPKEEVQDFNELDYDKQIEVLQQGLQTANQENQSTKAIIKAQALAPKWAEKLAKECSPNMQSDVQAVLNERLNDLALENPTFFEKDIPAHLKETLLDMAVGRVNRTKGTASGAAEPVGEVPSEFASVPNYSKVAKEMKALGITDPERIKRAALRYQEVG